MTAIHRHRRLLIAGLIGVAGLAGAAVSRTSASVAAPATVPIGITPASADHAYRVVGRARLILFTLSDDDVGGARLTWRRDAGSESVRLLAGSEPERAPRDLNEWGYSSEDTDGNRSDVFVVRSMTAADLVDRRPRDGAGESHTTQRRFQAVCSSVTGGAAQTYTTTVTTDQEITYHGVGSLLTRLIGTRQWQPRDVVPPAGAAPGFLTAISRLIRSSVEAAAAKAPQPTSVPYVYNAAVYDLQLRRVRPQHHVTVGGTTYDELLKGDFVAVRRRDNDPTAFTVTYPIQGPCTGVPIVIAFRASWWLSVELQLDDHYAVPPDPGLDAATMSTIRDICAPAWSPVSSAP